ncbi:MAG: hypothetical protein K2O69_04200 [Odoribacter sp.]|nr:hypothetical protein [Odoribacter sp.]
MYSNLESDERKRSEVTSSLFDALMGLWGIPKPIQDYYGFTDDYELYHKLEGMYPAEYRQKRQTGEIPDCLEVQARLIRSVEKVFESVCRHPPVEYLDMMNEELETLGRIAFHPDAIDDPFNYISRVLLLKYGIDKTASPEERSRQAEKAYRELDARFVKMTGREPYADKLFSSLKRKPEEERPRQSFFRKPSSKGRKMSL